MGEGCNGTCAVHGMSMKQVEVLHERTEELYQLVDKLREEQDVKIEKALAKQKEYLQEVMKSSAANTKLWMVGQGFAIVTLVIGVTKLM